MTSNQGALEDRGERLSRRSDRREPRQTARGRNRLGSDGCSLVRTLAPHSQRPGGAAGTARTGCLPAGDWRRSLQATSGCERIAHLLSTHGRLRTLFPQNRDLAYAWISTASRAFDDQAPVIVVREHGLKDWERCAPTLSARSVSYEPRPCRLSYWPSESPTARQTGATAPVRERRRSAEAPGPDKRTDIGRGAPISATAPKCLLW